MDPDPNWGLENHNPYPNISKSQYSDTTHRLDKNQPHCLANKFIYSKLNLASILVECFGPISLMKVRGWGVESIHLF